MNNEERKLFWETLCSLDRKDKETGVKKLNPTIKYPTFLFRYRPITVKNIDALRKNMLYFSRSSYYDDPFDTYLHIDYKIIYEQLVNSEEKKQAAIQHFRQICLNRGEDPQLIEERIKLINGTPTKKIIDWFILFLSHEIQPIIRNTSMSVCFSENGLNETMWLKYAEQYKGFCLIYNLEDAEKLLCGKYEKCENCGIYKYGMPLYPMYYSETRYDATNYADILVQEYFLRYIYPEMKEEEITSQIPSSLWEKEKVSLIKSKCHEYDSEWRIILPCPMREPVMCEWIPYGIILGLRISDSDKRIVIDSAKYAGIKHIFQSVIDGDGNLAMIEITEEINNA